MEFEVWPPAGVTLAYPEVNDMTPEDDGMAFDERFGDRRAAPGGAGNSKLLDFWKPSDRRRLGHLSFKAYDQSSIDCPTDLWTYQRLFIEQRRDEGNLWSKPAMHMKSLIDV